MSGKDTRTKINYWLIYKSFKFNYILEMLLLRHVHLFDETKGVRKATLKTLLCNNSYYYDRILSVTYLSFFSLFLWFEHMMSLVSMLATHLTHALSVIMAKKVEGSHVLRTGSGVLCGKLWVYAALSRLSVWQDLQIDGHRWWGRGGSCGGA